MLSCGFAVLQGFSHDKVVVGGFIVIYDTLGKFINGDTQMSAQCIQQMSDAFQHPLPQCKCSNVVFHACKKFSHSLIVGEAFFKRHYDVRDEAYCAVGYLSVEVSALAAPESEILLGLLVQDLYVPAYLVYFKGFYKWHGDI